MKKPEAQILILFLVVFSAIQCNSKSKVESPVSFEMDGTAGITFVLSNVIDTTNIFTQHWNFFPGEFIESDTLQVVKDGFYTLITSVQKPQFIKAYINDFQFEIFVAPGELDTIKIGFSEEYPVPDFSGPHKPQNDYNLSKYLHFNSWDIDLNRAQFQINSQTVDELIAQNDSVTNSELDFLEEYYGKHELPGDFYNYEKANLKLIDASYKLSGFIYLRDFYQKVDRIPDKYYDFLKNIDLNSDDVIFSYHYFSGVDYIMNQILKEKAEELDPHSLQKLSDDSLISLTNNLILEIIDSLLLEPHKDYFLLFKYFQLESLSQKRLKGLQEEMLHNIVDPELIAYASRYQSKNDRLKIGSIAPEIQLDDLSGRTLSLEKLKGNVVLLNFWSTGCLPCRKEIPEIAELAGDFKNQDFKIVTICLSHDKVQWNELVQDYPVNVISLITDRKQAAKLFEDYKIDGIPRFVLIDKYSMIADPYAPRPSDSSLKEAIEELLR